MPDTIAPKQQNPECLWKRTHMRVPREDDSIFMSPTLEEAVQQAQKNRELLGTASVSILNQPLQDFRVWARHEVLQAARDYTRSLLEHFPCSCSHHAQQFDAESKPELADRVVEYLYVSGHQPALFHPGVWVKNFGIHALAKQTDGIALNLIVDNDTINSTSISVPTNEPQQPQLTSIAFDEIRNSEPWENATIVNRDLFDSFADRVAESMVEGNIKPLLSKIWPDAITMAEQTTSLRDCLTVARHRQERRWGVNNLELPISRLCELDCFKQFALHIIENHEQFRQIHNEVLEEYRCMYRLRSKTHPVPELVQFDEGWVEVPFWVWRAGDSTRSRLRVKRVQQEMLFSDGDDVICSYKISPSKENGYAGTALDALTKAGYCLRTRALTTTLFSRVCFADLFVHGIGGAKYDEMTDQIIQRFFNVTPPGFLTMSATKYLPLAEPFPVSPDDAQQIRSQLRTLEYNPEQFLPTDSNDEVSSVISKQQQLIQQQKQAKSYSNRTRKERRHHSAANRQRYQTLKQIRSTLRPFVNAERARLSQQLEIIQSQLTTNQILHNREFSFALYPAETLEQFYSQF